MALFDRLRKLAERHEELAGWIDENIPEFLRFDRYFVDRQRVLENPNAVLTDTSIAVRRYILVGTASAYIIMLFSFLALDALSILPQETASLELQQVTNFEHALEDQFNKELGSCIARYETPAQCNQVVKRMLDEKFPTNDLETYKQGLKFAIRYKEGLPGAILFLNSLCLLLGSYLFAQIYLRTYPRAASTRSNDLKLVRRTYLITLGTTLFYPTVIATCCLTVSELVLRYSPGSGTALANILIFSGGIPLCVANVLCATRIHVLLSDTKSWRFGGVITIFFLSNLMSTVLFVVFSLLVGGGVWSLLSS